jgi:SAM-dependent methyltransferase
MAKANYPDIAFEVHDSTQLSFEKPFDTVFSNATLHTVTDAEQAARAIYDCLKTNGRFIFEMGGKNNVANIRHTIKQAAD